MPHTITIEAYHFDELDDKAKERARDWFRDGYPEYEWWKDIYDDAKQCFSYLGFNIKEIYFSGFCSQGDGACFTGTWYASQVEPDKLKEHAPQDTELHRIADIIEGVARHYPEASCTITHEGHYYHSHSVRFEVYDLLIDDDEKLLIEASRDAMDWIYHILEKEYEWLISDEQVDESIRLNEYSFDKTGRRVLTK